MSAFSISEPFPQFHDRAGQPLDGGFVWIGTAGLDAQANPIPVFFDAALTIPASQPIGTRSGFAANGATPTPVYCNANDYSIKILDANGTLVSSYANAVDRFPAAVITGSLSSANVSYNRALTGTQVRTVEGRLRDFTSVFDFMTPAQIAAVQASTFLVDVTVAVQAAISSPAREIYFPQGGYLISAPLSLSSVTVAKTLRGAGRQSSIIYNIGAGNALQSIGNPITQNTSITISDLNIEGQPGTGNGIFFEYTSQATIERVGLYGHGAAGIRVTRGAHIAIVDCWSRSNTGVALHIDDDAFFVDVRGGTYETSASGAYVVKSGAGLAPRYTTFTGCAFRGNTNANANIAESADTRFFGCSFNIASSATPIHIAIDGGGLGSVASGVLFDGCSIVGVNAGLTTIGVDAANCEDVAVVNSVVDCTGATAYNVAASAVRTRFFDNAVIVGTQTNASTSTVRRTFVPPTESRSFYGDGPWQLDFTGNTNAFRFRQSAIASVDSIFEYDGWRTWVDDTNANLMIKGTDPTTPTDGFSVGPGLLSYTVANLPVGAPVGYMAIVTNHNALPVWGAAPVGGGVFTAAVINWGGAWTIIGRP